ncbi:hypothetical protein [Bradyrhizobium sp. AS23.2]|uniref:hypothetical protein n=1 Tax=Bradyrhizobium sp. AS23.2 TaxID=1680155 RepID=UPI0011612D93|nr:hypothetical protein [Bradyrhizobium sp. AS23.2]
MKRANGWNSRQPSHSPDRQYGRIDRRAAVAKSARIVIATLPVSSHMICRIEDLAGDATEDRLEAKAAFGRGELHLEKLVQRSWRFAGKQSASKPHSTAE